MKIPFERLNEIIEEEVSKFKELNRLDEQTLNLTLNLTEFTAQNERIRDLATKDGNQATLDKYAKALGNIK